MDIYVCEIQVPDPEAIVRVKSDTELEIENKYFTSFFDEIAIEAGMKLKEKFGGKVTVLTLDNKKVDALRRGISMGADEAVQIADPALEGADLFGIAKALAAFLKGKPYDLILAGRQAMDDDAGIVGPAVVELLGDPHDSIVGLEVQRPEERGEGRTGSGEWEGDPDLSPSSPLHLPEASTCPASPGQPNVIKATKAQIPRDPPRRRSDVSGTGCSSEAMKVRKIFPAAEKSAGKDH